MASAPLGTSDGQGGDDGCEEEAQGHGVEGASSQDREARKNSGEEGGSERDQEPVEAVRRQASREEAQADEAVVTGDRRRQDGPREGGVGDEWDEETVEDAEDGTSEEDTAEEETVTEADRRSAASDQPSVRWTGGQRHAGTRRRREVAPRPGRHWPETHQE
jgi:hypothetical protein